MRISVLGQPYVTPSLGAWLKEQLRCLKWRECLMATALISDDAVDDFLADLQLFVALGGSVVVYTGVDLDTSASALRRLQDLVNTRVYIVHDGAGRATFHPKVYLFKNEHSASLVVTSANFTRAGLWYNFEVSVILDLDLPQEEYVVTQLRQAVESWTDVERGLCSELGSALLDALLKSGVVSHQTQAKRVTTALPQGIFKQATVAVPDAFSPRFFFLTLLPGDLPQRGSSPEIRITKFIRDRAPDFWGWQSPPPPDPETGRISRSIKVGYLGRTLDAVLRDFPPRKPGGTKASGDFRLGNIAPLWHAFQQVEDILMLERLDRASTTFTARVILAGSSQHTSLLPRMSSYEGARSRGYVKKYLYL